MALFGGELAAEASPYSAYFTDSGRSSLRLILQSGFGDKVFLLPDFLCGVIPQVMTELGVRFGFYHVDNNLAIDAASVKQQKFDVLYVIDYFGSSPDYSALTAREQWVIEDCVFLPTVPQRNAHPNWIGFNSLRKASALADGSVVVSAQPLKRELIRSEQAPFAAPKYAAKLRKHEFLTAGVGKENDYLRMFAQAEGLVDAQREIYSMSVQSAARYLSWLDSLEYEYRRRKENLDILRQRLGRFEIWMESDRPSHFVIAVDRRDQLRQQLREHQVFLPSHWPHTHGPRNPLYDRLLAISVDARYGAKEITRVAELISGLMR